MYQPCSSPDPGHFSGCNLEIRAWKKRAQISMPVGWRGPKPASTHFHGPAWCGQKERPAKLRKSKLSTLATTSITFEGPSNSNLNNLNKLNIKRFLFWKYAAQYKYMKLLLLSIITYYYYMTIYMSYYLVACHVLQHCLHFPPHTCNVYLWNLNCILSI